MRASFSPPNQLMLEGSASELDELAQALCGDAGAGVSRDLQSHDPKPYARSLRRLYARVGDGPTVISVASDDLTVTGAIDNIKIFASFIRLGPGDHIHCEYYPGNESIAATSIPLVISCSE